MALKKGGTKRARKSEAGKMIRVGRQGRVVIPAEMRARMGFGEGDGLEVVAQSAGTFTVRVVKGADLGAAWEAARRAVREAVGDRDLVAELIAERRRDARKERRG